jgi:hypothetical protein
MLKEAAAPPPNRRDRLRTRSESPLEHRLHLIATLGDRDTHAICMARVGVFDAGAFFGRPAIQQASEIGLRCGPKCESVMRGGLRLEVGIVTLPARLGADKWSRKSKEECEHLIK